MSAEGFLSPRLKLIAKLAEQGKCVLDIGTDHAYVPIVLAERGSMVHGIASDVKQGPVDRARENVKKFGVENKVEVRLGSGFETVKPKEADTAIIAGMGGLLINEILAEGKRNGKLEGCETLVLQPMIAAYELRMFLPELGYHIEHEAICREGRKLYTVIEAKKGVRQVSDEFEYYFSIPMRGDPLAADYLRHMIKVNKSIAEGMRRSAENHDIKQIKWLIETCQRTLEETQ